MAAAVGERCTRDAHAQALGKKVEVLLQQLSWEAGSAMPPCLRLCGGICKAAGAPPHAHHVACQCC